MLLLFPDQTTETFLATQSVWFHGFIFVFRSGDCVSGSRLDWNEEIIYANC